jgi:tRNA(Leu) C34 or U34 (ribose-2'-O)-methylase TrmL
MNLAATVNVVLYDRLAKASRKAAKAERATD